MTEADRGGSGKSGVGTPLGSERLQGIIRSWIRGQGLTAAELSQSVLRRGGPAEQAEFYANVVRQLEDEVKMAGGIGEQADVSREPVIRLAGRLNMMAGYLVTLDIADRRTAIALADALGSRCDGCQKWPAIRRGLVGSVGAYLMLAELGIGEVRFPTGEEDAEQKVDMHVGDGVLQLKSRKGLKQVRVFTTASELETEVETTLAGLDLNDANSTEYADRLRRELASFQILVDYAGTVQKQAYFVMLPTGLFDAQTGEMNSGYDMRELDKLRK